MPSDLLEGFQKTDAAADAQALFGFLDAIDGMPFVKACKQQMRDLAPVAPGQRILDVGCGLGHELQRIVASIGPTGRAVGIDHGAPTIVEARRRAEALALPLELYVSDAHKLDFPDDTFDLCRAERVFEYVAEPRQVLAEMVRVARPGGAVVVFDFDYDGMIIDHADRTLLRQVKQIAFASVPHGGIATELPALFRAAGLVDVCVAPFVFTPPFMVFERLLGTPLERAVERREIAPEAVASWWSRLREAAIAGRFFGAFPGFIVAGRKAKGTSSTDLS